MKKRVCCTMSLVLAASMITTCMPAVTASADDTVTLTIWGDVDNQVTLEDPFEEINAAFEEAHPTLSWTTSGLEPLTASMWRRSQIPFRIFSGCREINQIRWRNLRETAIS